MPARKWRVSRRLSDRNQALETQSMNVVNDSRFSFHLTAHSPIFKLAYSVQRMAATNSSERNTRQFGSGLTDLDVLELDVVDRRTNRIKVKDSSAKDDLIL